MHTDILQQDGSANKLLLLDFTNILEYTLENHLEEQTCRSHYLVTSHTWSTKKIHLFILLCFQMQGNTSVPLLDKIPMFLLGNKGPKVSLLHEVQFNNKFIIGKP